MNELPTCWWCGNHANSREHKFKASELRASHGIAWQGDSAVVHGTFEGAQQVVRGPKADELKWAPSMCQDCNNRRSQPFDRAYDQLLGFIQTNEDIVLEANELSFQDVFGNDWRNARANLVKYWVKHICCRAVDMGLAVPQAICDFLDSTHAIGEPPHIRMGVSVNQALIDMVGGDALHFGSYFSDAQGWGDRETGELIGFDAAVGWGWLTLSYEYRLTEPLGATTFPGVELPL